MQGGGPMSRFLTSGRRRYALPLFVAAGSLIPLSTPATAVAKRKHQCTITTRGAFIDFDYGYPNAGTSAKVAGVFDESCDGGKVTTHGASESRNTITDISSGGANSSVNASAGSQAVVGHFKTEGTSYSDRGTLTTTTTGTATPQPDDRFSISGESKITGGTRLYRGAAGSGTFTGSIDPRGVVTTQGTSTETY